MKILSHLKPPIKNNFVIEYRRSGVSGFLIFKGKLNSFEEAQKQRDILIASGATEALIKKI